MAPRKNTKPKGVTKGELNKISSELKKSITDTKPKAFGIQDIINWLFDGQEILIPLSFRRNKSTLLNYVQMIIPKFRNNYKMINLMNVNFNDLYSKRTGEELLEFLKSYVQLYRLSKKDLDNTFYRFDKVKGARDRYIEHMSESTGIMDGGDFGSIVSSFDMMSTGLFVNKEVELKINTSLGNQVASGNLEADMTEALRLNNEQKLKKDPRFIKELSQVEIDKYKLTLIDIKCLEKLNKILLIFIDENNKKKFFMDDFSYEFILSNISSIIYNDYVSQFDPRYHTCVVCTNAQDLMKLRMALNKERDNFYKRIAWDQ